MTEEPISGEGVGWYGHEFKVDERCLDRGQ